MTKGKGLSPRGWVIAIALSALTIVGLVAASDRRDFELVKNLDIFYTLVRELNSFYVEEIDPGKLIKTGIDAMLESLDPYTSFIPESEMETFRFMTTGEYGGIGALITQRGRHVVISEPYVGFPAHEAGLRAGDRILEIDGESMLDKGTAQVSEKLRGSAGTQVQVLFERVGTRKPLRANLTRRVIQINPVPYYGMINENTGLIILNNFTQGCAQEVENALINLRKNPGMKNLILDLRGNPGGLMDEAVKIANLFLPRGSEVVSTRGKVPQWNRTYRAPREPIDTIMPLAILINRGSASASEIVAGAIQDHDRGLVIGQRSFGKGLVQTTRRLAFNTSLKVTTARYYIPSGRGIQAVDFTNRNDDGSVGLIPDSLIREFQTKGGRSVFDGGGISPDIILKPEDFSNMTRALLTQQTIFDFATEFASRNPSLPAPAEFAMSDQIYNEFIDFVTNLEGFEYESRSQEYFNKLKASAQREEYYELAMDSFKELELALTPDVGRDLKLFKEEISEFLSLELIRRYHHQRGAIIFNSTRDKDIKAAASALADYSTYKQMLNGTVLTHAGDKRMSSGN